MTYFAVKSTAVVNTVTQLIDLYNKNYSSNDLVLLKVQQ